MPDPTQEFAVERTRNVDAAGKDDALLADSLAWILAASRHRYSYNFSWLGRPIIQLPPDIVAMQELIWAVKPDLIIETGIAHGGSLVLSASMLALLDYAEAVEKNDILDPRRPKRKVLGLDIDIRPHNRSAIEAHPMSSRIEMIQGSSIERSIISQVHSRASDAERVLVALDSNHTHDHVLAELEAYSPLVSVGSYCIVFDTLIEDSPAGSFPDRPWDKGNNPKTAVWDFLKRHPEFQVDKQMDHKLLISVAPDGYLLRVK